MFFVMRSINLPGSYRICQNHSRDRWVLRFKGHIRLEEGLINMVTKESLWITANVIQNMFTALCPKMNFGVIRA